MQPSVVLKNQMQFAVRTEEATPKLREYLEEVSPTPDNARELLRDSSVLCYVHDYQPSLLWVDCIGWIAVDEHIQL